MDSTEKNEITQLNPTYSLAFRTMAVRQLRETGYSVAELGLAIGVHPDTLLSWMRQFEDGSNQESDGKKQESAGDYDLKFEMEILKQERNRMRTSVDRNLQLAERGGALGGEKSLVPTGTLQDMLETLLESRWLILGIVLLTLLVGIAHLMIAEPVYRADGLLEVDEAGADLSVTENLPTLFKEVSPVTAEIEMLKSRLVLGQVVDNLGLSITSKPVHLPIVGAAIVRRMPSTKLAKPLLGIGGYAWGGERIKIENFNVPETYFGEAFTLIAKQSGHYQFLDPSGNEIFQGEVKKFESTQLSEGNLFTLYVSELRAKPETRFEIIHETRLKQIETIKKALTVREKGDRTRLLEVIFDWSDKERIEKITNEIISIYVQQNSERKSGELNQTIGFLEKQLTMLRDQMQIHVATLNTYRLEKGVTDLSNESKIILQKIVSTDAQLSRLRDERQELIQKFTPQHSRIIALDAQISSLKKELGGLNWKVKRLPNTEQEILHLIRDVEVDTDLYSFVKNRLQELKMVNAAPVGNVKVVDFPAASDEPVKPQIVPMLTLYTMLGISLALATVFIRKVFHTGVEDPDILEKRFGYPVYAIVPHSAYQDKMLNQLQLETKGSVEPSILMAQNAKDPASESIRSLRTSLHFAVLDAKNNILLITGPGPDIGKSFLCLNLAAALASGGKRVLLIDADLRKGKLHKHFGIQNVSGLSNLISGRCGIQEATQKTSIANLLVIPAGTYPPNPSELLLHPRFASALEQMAINYDHVIIDSPPILPVTDAAIIGHLAGATFLVVKAGEHTLRSIEESIKRLTQADANFRGFVFNDLAMDNPRYGYGKHYGYYSSYSTDQ
ncbi:MAG: polysaccharide biosynthesis tyrosine autokinase [Methylococcales bacterium]